ncbi:MAG: hypothetical protein KGL53_11535, partial [Elusimicrobia bacterium]|nr:hypothetical protein [Elusimicrobiota bacterium]
YQVNVGVLGDTAPGCAKAFVAEFTCPKYGKRKVALAPEAHGKIAHFDCDSKATQIDPIAAAPRPAAPVSNSMTINSAFYGTNCRARNPNVTAKVAGSCNGKEKCAYQVNVGVLGDTAPGCAKTFVAEYTCPKQGKRKIALAAEAHGKIAPFDCSK